jgi:ketosteroid isomerase-like protein
MRRKLPLAFLALTFPGIAVAAPCPKPDPAAVVKTMTDMFAAFTVDDGAKLAAIFSPDAVEFDGGKRFTGSGLWDLIKTVHGEGVRLVWTVQDADVHFACDTAWIDYINRGSVSDGKTTTPVTWLESAVLMYGKTGWRIRFLHSTQVPAPKPTK